MAKKPLYISPGTKRVCQPTKARRFLYVYHGLRFSLSIRATRSFFHRSRPNHRHAAVFALESRNRPPPPYNSRPNPSVRPASLFSYFSPHSSSVPRTGGHGTANCPGAGSAARIGPAPPAGACRPAWKDVLSRPKRFTASAVCIRLYSPVLGQFCLLVPLCGLGGTSFPLPFTA
jgi:hypothetical protein